MPSKASLTASALPSGWSAQQLAVAWVNYVHERFASQPNTNASARQRSLVLAMPMGAPVKRDDLEGLTPKLAKLYAATGPRVLSRDLNALKKLGLMRQGQARPLLRTV
jgi:hypothetical protein